MNKEIQEKIPVFSYLMMCILVLYHCQIPEELYDITGIDSVLNTTFTSCLSNLCALGMRWFFTITGFLLFRKLSFHTLGKKLKTRVHSLLIPYLIWCVIYLLKSILQGNHWTIYDAVAQIFFLRIWPPLPPFWYVYAAFLLALLSPFFLLLFQNRRIGALSVFLGGIIAMVYWKSTVIAINGHYHYLTNILWYFTPYLLGAFYGNMYSEENRTENLMNLKYLALFLLAALLLDNIISDLFLEFASASIPLLMLFLLPVPLWSKKKKIYSASFLMLATHQLLISISTGIIYHFLFLAPALIPIVGIIGRLLCLCFVCTANYAIYRLMRRFAPQTLLLLTGGRAN